jgi:putative NADH-flavin reductase
MSERTRRVCIVGASGKLGQYMVQHALDRGYEVVSVCREQSVGKLDVFKGRITVVPGATNDAEVIKKAVSGCDGVLVVLVPRGVHGYSTGTAQAVLDHALGARASCSRAGGTSPATARTCTRGRSKRW